MRLIGFSCLPAAHVSLRTTCLREPLADTWRLAATSFS
jgi:hypothetical protein